ncbi:pentapeptide repeat-containing protein [Arthrobacter sp. CDRTa11]|uniref:pentapeptide repeat-containing protein n=1 Tax=Arthrobacter sp. CDRTa11 TaxID=2651199 RepID=UPI00226599F2|nr:pentapeptide repeat-containing protein [Arthrobacter sp. CDRTa11]UZX04015.1 pentapeptide repeat-containing protein [Arthrobacter sp. CDRTa11]
MKKPAISGLSVLLILSCQGCRNVGPVKTTKPMPFPKSGTAVTDESATPRQEATPQGQLPAARTSSWRHDLVVGLVSGIVVAFGTLLVQLYFDDLRSDREAGQEDLRSAREGRQNNLQFLRDRSSTQPLDRPFNGMDLAGQNLSGLELQNSDLINSDLSGADLQATSLQGSILSGADMSRTKLEAAGLERASLVTTDLRSAQARGSDLTDAVMWGADVSGANFVLAAMNGTDFRVSGIESAELINSDGESVCYDENTKWPEGYQPPAMNRVKCAERWGYYK